MKSEAKLEIRIGNFDDLEAESLAEWRAMSPQDRLDAFVELMRIWHRDAPGFVSPLSPTCASIERVPNAVGP